MNDLLKTAQEAVRQASEICSRIQSRLVDEDTLTKKDRSPVTIADYASQAVICKVLHDTFPEIPIVGEEDAQSLREEENRNVLEKVAEFLPGWSHSDILDAIDLGNGEAQGRYWTLDPIDGTKGFLRGDQYAVALALIESGEIQLGVLGCPNLSFDENQKDGTLAYAVKGGGSYATAIHGDSIRENRVAAGSPDEAVRFLESVESGHANHGLQGQIMSYFGEQAQSVRYDSQVKYAVLAAGKADVYLRLPNPKYPDYREKIWDHAAGVIVIREAGGRATDMYGKELDFTQGKKLLNNRGVIVTNGTVHETIIQLLKDLS
ncbi:MAG TPA: 3'(2'),5'-bisphosphate nucleotidase [Caldithrix abyssi]|uniref:3'(2'),5'-bisphosphate nucleotidase n=1 Tax=Caldithrix abyssi TaxID=187145 RepID=A0A7V4U0I6_CALAY|nr:3'(2'),5'-bisphosphate nucleotidase [Caldithrix abyssi]